MKLFLLLLFSACIFTASGQSIVRGPYLQKPTQESIIVMWRTSTACNSRVIFGTDSLNLNQTISSSTNVTDHQLTLSNLQPYTTYYYAVGTSTTILTANISKHHFRTHPLPGTELPINIWAIGDFGKGNAGQVATKTSYLHYMDTTKTDVWLWLGDNVYDDGKDSEYQAKVFSVNGFSDVFSWIPFYPTPGNHDYNEIWSESTFLGIPYTNIPLSDHEGPYYDIVEVHQQAEAGGHPSNLEVFYSFDYGNVHFISLNSEVWDLGQTLNGVNQMKAWLIQDLQQNQQLFTIAYFHQPPYSKGSHDSDGITELVMKTMREEIIPVLEDYDVDMVICGHSHVYERSKLINGHYGNSSSFNPPSMLIDGSSGDLYSGTPYLKDSTVNTSDGTVYVVCGNSGSSESTPTLNHPIMFYAEGNSYGSFIMNVYKNKLEAVYLRSDTTIRDKFTILKKNLALLPMGQIHVCPGDSVTLQIQHTGGSDSLLYAWSIGNSTTASNQILPSTSGTYSVQVSDLLTGQILTQSFQIVMQSPPVLSVQLQNDTLFAVPPADAYQWYMNGNPISGETQSYFVPSSNGVYHCVGTFNGCLSQSADFIFTASGIFELDDSEVLVFPNPNSGSFEISLREIKWDNYSLIDQQGKIISTGKIRRKRTTISMESEPAGTYYLILSGEGKSVSRIIQKVNG
jgi:hypothetical protein